MNDEKRPESLDKESQDELDAFARALLNRKTEMRIFRDEDSDEMEIGFSDDDRQEAERSMSQALDMLRKSRGQKTIEEEESAFWFEEEEPQAAQTAEEPKAGQKSQKKRREPKPVRRKKKSRDSRKDQGRSAGKESKPADGSRKTDTDRPVDKPKKKPADRKVKRSPATTRRRRIIGAIIAVCVLAAAGLGVYCWKVLVWDPQNLVSQAQEASYLKLVDYADEYGSGLMSDAEKAEILDLKDDYDGLAPRQKTELETYFREQTKSDQYPQGRTFDEIYAEEADKKQAADDSTKPEYQELVSWLGNWNEKSDDEKRQILNYRDAYNNLSQALKNQVDDMTKAATGKTFSQLASEQEESIRSDQVAQQAQIDAQKADLQAQIDALNAELEPYVTYGDSLNADLNEARIAGQDTADIESQIVANNGYIQDLQSQISALEYQRDSLQ